MFEITIRKSLSNADRINWIRLSRSRNIGRTTLLNLIKIFDNVEDAINNVGNYSLQGGLSRPIELASFKSAQQELEECHKLNAQIICFNEEKYPVLLREIGDPPPIITARGRVDLMYKNIVAIVGTRNPSTNGCKFAEKIAYELGQSGLIISSGMARGIDASAHYGAINSGTIGVIAGGVDNIYPAENTALYKEVIQKGLLVSENPLGSPPKGGNFPQRNRIISGLSLGVAVIEATLRSGTLITSRFAAEQNREIFAVPGSPFDPRYEGTNRLIKQGAKLIENSNDVLEEIMEIIKNRERFAVLNESFDKEFENIKFKAPDEDIIREARKLILQKVNYSPISIELLIDELELPVKIANIAFVQLELADRIESKNGKVSLKQKD